MFLFKNSLSQNLIQNGSFENYTNPIDCNGGFDNSSVFPINHVVDNWYTLNSPDYFNPVCNNNYADVPVNLFGYSMPKQGNSYIGIITFLKVGETKEYTYQQLSAPLQAGKIYCLSFFVSKADGITHSIKNIGAYFSISTPTLFSNFYVNATPQVVNQNGFITDTTSWAEIQGCFTANGGEQYISIGNFNSNANTDTLYVGSNNLISGGSGYSYYYIDDITLIDQSTVGVNEFGNGSFEVYPNPTNDVLNFKGISDKENLTIKITDVIGRDVLVSEFKSQLDISSLEKGIYFVSIQQGTKSLGVKKIINQ